ncbi:hypothetical protein TCE0_033f08113 [Talaromyces pinophilus]|uniref:Uncharacterized protein n=1 Tax=Talaromyces pinophilus TaxID=128442 RepID=A0A6V8H8W6_TALPI|nr:hypothetical protein TCE0_033f08113 [Talaromyces pinophilus]
MLMTTTFGLNTVKQTVAQRGMSWSTLSGWGIVAFEIYCIIFNKKKRQHITPLWIVLFSITTLAWAFALSGLTMSVYNGFKAGTVVGVNWEAALVPTLPLNAALYVPPGSKTVPNVSTSNDFPDDASSGIFLAPQASLPVTGNIWGLLCTYSCSEVVSEDQFTILNRRINTSDPAYIQPTVYYNSSVDYFYTLDDGSSISVLPAIDPTAFGGSELPLTIGFAEIGISTGLGSIMVNTSLYTYTPFQNGSLVFDSRNGLDSQEVLEIIVWQGLVNGTKIQNPIPGLDNEPLRGIPADSDDQLNVTMQAIGIRCVSSSVTGLAEINGLASTFINFTTEFAVSNDGESFDTPYGDLLRLSFGVPLMVGQLDSDFTDEITDGGVYPEDLLPFGNSSINYTIFNNNLDWMSLLYEAANIARSPHINPLGLSSYMALMQSTDLKTAILNAYKQYAYSLMYYKADAPGDLWPTNNLTAAIPSSLIQSDGGVPPLVVVVLMMIWAVSCTALSITYGFRRRYSDTFDDYQLFCYCKEKGLDPMEVLESQH